MTSLKFIVIGLVNGLSLRHATQSGISIVRSCGNHHMLIAKNKANEIPANI